MIGDLAFVDGLEDLLCQLLQQSILAGQLALVSLRPVHQLTDQLIAQCIRLQPCRLHCLHSFDRHGLRCSRCYFLPEDPPLTVQALKRECRRDGTPITPGFLRGPDRRRHRYGQLTTSTITATNN